MNNEYIIINKTTLEKRIKELENTEAIDRQDGIEIYKEMYVLKQILSQSIPLIPEIEKAINSGIRSFESNAYEIPELIEEIQQNYISNLKLDI